MSEQPFQGLKAELAVLLVGEADFVAELAALGLQRNGELTAPTKVLKGFRPLASLGQENYPCWVLESGDDQLTEEAIGSQRQIYESEILLSLVWHQQDRDTAVDQRDALLPALVRLLLRNPVLSSCGMRVDARGNDRNANHPTHVATFRLLADVTIDR